MVGIDTSSLTAYHHNQEKETRIEDDRQARQARSYGLRGFQQEDEFKVEITLDTKFPSRQA